MGSPLSDAIRIVPVYGAGALAEPAHGVAAAAAPRLVYGGGPLLGAVEVVTVFLGSWWEAGQGAELTAELNDFFDFVLTSALIDQLGEYAVPGTGWYDQVHGEIGDICAWQTKKVGVYAVQLEWSNREGTCV